MAAQAATATMPPCAPGTHRITLPANPDVRAVRCQTCARPVALYTYAMCFCGEPASFESTGCGNHTVQRRDD